MTAAPSTFSVLALAFLVFAVSINGKCDMDLVYLAYVTDEKRKIPGIPYLIRIKIGLGQWEPFLGTMSVTLHNIVQINFQKLHLHCSMC